MRAECRTGPNVPEHSWPPDAEDRASQHPWLARISEVHGLGSCSQSARPRSRVRLRDAAVPVQLPCRHDIRLPPLHGVRERDVWRKSYGAGRRQRKRESLRSEVPLFPFSPSGPNFPPCYVTRGRSTLFPLQPGFSASAQMRLHLRVFLMMPQRHLAPSTLRSRFWWRGGDLSFDGKSTRETGKPESRGGAATGSPQEGNRKTGWRERGSSKTEGASYVGSVGT